MMLVCHFRVTLYVSALTFDKTRNHSALKEHSERQAPTTRHNDPDRKELLGWFNFESAHRMLSLLGGELDGGPVW